MLTLKHYGMQRFWINWEKLSFQRLKLASQSQPEKHLEPRWIHLQNKCHPSLAVLRTLNLLIIQATLPKRMVILRGKIDPAGT